MCSWLDSLDEKLFLVPPAEKAVPELAADQVVLNLADVGEEGVLAHEPPVPVRRGQGVLGVQAAVTHGGPSRQDTCRSFLGKNAE